MGGNSSKNKGANQQQQQQQQAPPQQQPPPKQGPSEQEIAVTNELMGVKGELHSVLEACLPQYQQVDATFPRGVHSYMQPNTDKKTFQIENKPYGDEAAIITLVVWRRSTGMVTLKLSGVGMTDEGAEILAVALRRAPPTLRAINLTHNKLTARGAWYILHGVNSMFEDAPKQGVQRGNFFNVDLSDNDSMWGDGATDAQIDTLKMLVHDMEASRSVKYKMSLPPAPSPKFQVGSKFYSLDAFKQSNVIEAEGGMYIQKVELPLPSVDKAQKLESFLSDLMKKQKTDTPEGAQYFATVLFCYREGKTVELVINAFSKADALSEIMQSRVLTKLIRYRAFFQLCHALMFLEKHHGAAYKTMRPNRFILHLYLDDKRNECVTTQYADLDLRTSSDMSDPESEGCMVFSDPDSVNGKVTPAWNKHNFAAMLHYAMLYYESDIKDKSRYEFFANFEAVPLEDQLADARAHYLDTQKLDEDVVELIIQMTRPDLDKRKDWQDALKIMNKLVEKEEKM